MGSGLPCIFCARGHIYKPRAADVISVLNMPRLVHLVLLFLMVALVACLEEASEPVQMEIEPSPNNANDLEADASRWGRPWRYGTGWKSGWNGWRGGSWNFGGNPWGGRGGWW